MMTGVSREEYRDMMLNGGRSIEGNRYKSEWEKSYMARLTAGVGCSHVPAIGIAMDQGITEQPYWIPAFEGV